MALQVIDRAMQAFGAEGLSQDTPLAEMYANLRTLRIADVCLFPCTFGNQIEDKCFAGARRCAYSTDWSAGAQARSYSRTKVV